MKRYGSMLVVFLLIALLTACGGNPAEPTAPSTAPSVKEPAEAPTIAVPESTAPPTEPEEHGPHFQSMDMKDIQYWFFDFARLYRLDQMPTVHPEYGPEKNAITYADWVYFRNRDSFRGETIEMPRVLLDREVETHFGFLLEKYPSDPVTWLYDEKTQLFSRSYSPYELTDPHHYRLNTMEYADGIYTAQATVYTNRFSGNEEMDLELKRQLFQGDTRKLIATWEITLRFRLDPDTLEPLFVSYVKEGYFDFPKP